MTKASIKERTAPLFGEVDPPAKPKAEVAKVATPKAKKKTGTEVAVHKPLPPVAPKSLLEVIKDAAADPRVDVAKMKELLTMAREEEARIAERSFTAALRLAQEQVRPVVKNATGAHDIRYATLEKVSKQVDPIARQNGFSLSYGMSDSPIDAHYRITAKLSHVDGHTRDYFIDLPSDVSGPRGGGNKNPTQGVGSTISYGRRYLKCLIFDLVIANEDTDAAAMPPAAINANQVKDLRARMTAANITDEQFCAVYKIEKVEQLPAVKLQNALDRIAQKQKATA